VACEGNEQSIMSRELVEAILGALADMMAIFFSALMLMLMGIAYLELMRAWYTLPPMSPLQFIVLHWRLYVVLLAGLGALAFEWGIIRRARKNLAGRL
jgi:hypothetical protein